MKVKIKPYVCYKRWSYKYFLDPIERSIDYFYGEAIAETAIERLEETLIVEGIMKVLDPIGESLSDWLDSRRVSVKIHRWDTYSMDSTLTCIIIPMLKQIRKELNSAPLCNYEDADVDLRPTKEDITRMAAEPGWTDENFFKRWENILDKMIEAFEIHQEDVLYPKDAKKEKLENGLRLFGKYYMNLWT